MVLEVFPKCQFMITTHSPHVINHCHSDHVFHLSMRDQALSVEQPTETNGKSIDRTLQDQMGLPATRPDKIHDRLNELFTAIDRRDLTMASDLRSALRADIGEDPDLVKAGVLIKRMELIGK